jgi:hypothetical protein
MLGQVLVPTLKHWYAYQLVYPITVGLVKFSILAQYYRIFEVQNFRRQVIAVGIFVAVYTIVCIFVNVSLHLHPLSGRLLTEYRLLNVTANHGERGTLRSPRAAIIFQRPTFQQLL